MSGMLEMIMRVRLGTILSLALCLAGFTAKADPPPSKITYRPVTNSTCDGYARAPIEMSEGFCAGLVAAPPAQGPRTLVFPRTLLALPGGDFLVVDMGGWGTTRGAVFRLTARPGQAPVLRRILSGLNMPHMAAVGPDGKIYLGEMNRIIRFDPDAYDPRASIEVVVADLPSNRLHDNRHPLSSFLFALDGALIVNVGAPSDQCVKPAPRPGARCAEAEGPQAAAGLWRYAYLGNGRWSDQPTVLARGLRNSLALALHASGSILQGENSIDLPGEYTPFDEINLIEPGRFYGWPYCMDALTPVPAWKAAGAMTCRDETVYTPPVLLLPPHSAPLSMLYYQGPMFPELKGHLLVALHGYRSAGARIIAYDVDERGVPRVQERATYQVYMPGTAAARLYRQGPAAFGLILTPGWNAQPGRRPMGTPVGLTVAADGAIWVAEDKNGTILRIARDRR
ncbi:MAG: PQQ-dependent sugar dehydrogenase [Caulobacteraceae bacterium]